MAILDIESNHIVVRIVYAGPPLAGKTESLRALADMLMGNRAAQAMFSPDEAHGRTLYFDWLNYIGGSFKGRRVCCQIISVPGQSALSERRRLIMESADAVIFVVDSHPEQMEAATHFFQEMAPWLSRPEDDPPVGVMVQANKRDLPNAVPVDEIKEALGDDPNLGVVETTATQGTGIREAFVTCVGLSLERVGALMNSGRLATGKPEVVNGEELLHHIETSEASTHTDDGAADSAIEHIDTPQESKKAPALVQELSSSIADLSGSDKDLDAELATPDIEPRDTTKPPRLPDDKLAAGTIWPPVAGRIILHEVSKKEKTAPTTDQDGNWIAWAEKRWQLISKAEAIFQTLEQGRPALLAYARRHKTIDTALSAHRCVALAPVGNKQWRCWEIVRVEKTLADALEAALNEGNPAVLATKVCLIAHFLIRANESFSTYDAPLSASLKTVGQLGGKPAYTGIMPMEIGSRTKPKPIPDLIRTQFTDPITQALAHKSIPIPIVLRRLKQIRNTPTINGAVIETLSALFIGH